MKLILRKTEIDGLVEKAHHTLEVILPRSIPL